jgi:cell surface protein SprA
LLILLQFLLQKESTIGFGALEQGPNQRSREDIQQYNIVTNVNLGKLLPPNGVLTFLLITPLAKKITQNTTL